VTANLVDPSGRQIKKTGGTAERFAEASAETAKPKTP
jgi:hypothetical protein